MPLLQSCIQTLLATEKAHTHQANFKLQAGAPLAQQRHGPAILMVACIATEGLSYDAFHEG